MKGKFVFKGGAGSGHHGHQGRPGKQGGSTSSGSSGGGGGSGATGGSQDDGMMSDTDVVQVVRASLNSLASKTNNWSVRDSLMGISNRNLDTDYASIDVATAKSIVSQIKRLSDRELLRFDENDLMTLEGISHQSGY